MLEFSFSFEPRFTVFFATADKEGIVGIVCDVRVLAERAPNETHICVNLGIAEF